MVYVPNGEPSQHTTSKEHSHVDGRGLNHSADGDNHAHELHETDAAEFIADEGLCQSSHGLAGDIHGNDLVEHLVDGIAQTIWNF